MTEIALTRRQLLLTTGTIALAGFAPLAGAPPLTFLDGMLSAQERAIATRELPGYRPDVLKLDLIWEWRDDLHSRIAQGANLIAITRWDKALLLKDLAREAGFQIGQRRIANSLFRTDIRSL